jgi:hypothetical protein
MMYSSPMLPLLAARARFLRVAAAANGQAAAALSAASTAGYSALDAARQRRGWFIDESVFALSSHAARAPESAVAAAAPATAAGAIADALVPSRSAWRGVQASAQRAAPSAPSFARHDSTHFGAGAARARAAEAAAPASGPTHFTSAERGATDALLRRSPDVRGLLVAPLPGLRRQFSTASGSGATHGTAADSTSTHSRPVFVKVGRSEFMALTASSRELASMWSGEFIDKVADGLRFGEAFVGRSRSHCRVFMLRKVAGDEPTTAEEADVVELRGAATVGKILARADPSTSAYFFKVLVPVTGQAAVGENSR